MFEYWLARWGLTPDGEAFATAFGSHLMPVRQAGAAFPATRFTTLPIGSNHHEIDF
jgi:streptomycin 6-kinase